MRLLDIILSILAILVFLPLFLILALILRLTGEGEVFFLQERIGKNHQAFKVIKFATMLKNSPNIGSGTITAKNDERILPVGRVLRKTKINELPQLLNVVIGQMSLIGPRPHAKRDLEGVPPEYLEMLLELKPGLSGIGSIVFRNEEEILSEFVDPRPFYDNVIAPYKASLECWYYHNRSFYVNIKLIVLTITSVFGISRSVYESFYGLPSIPEELLPYLSSRKF